MTPAEPVSSTGRDRVVALLSHVLLGLVVAVPVVFDPRQGYGGSRPKYVVLILGAGLGGILLLGASATGERPLRGTWLMAPVLFFLAATAASTAASDHRTISVFGFPGLRHGLTSMLCFTVVLFATVCVAQAGKARLVLEALWFGAGGGVLLFGLGQLQDRLFSHNEGWNWARPVIAPWTIGSTLGNPNHLCAFLAMLLPVCIVLGITGTHRQRRLILAMAVVTLVEIGITLSRGGILGAVAGLMALGVLFRGELVRRRRMAIRLTGAAFALVVLVVVVFGNAGVTKNAPGRLVRAGPGSTLDIRLEVWGAAWRMSAEHPVLGVGPDVFPVLFPAYVSERFMRLYGPFAVANGAHNLFFDTLAELGALGLASFLSLLAVVALRLRRAWRQVSLEDHNRRLLLGGVAAALVAYLVQASFNTEDIALTLSFWVLVGLAVALSTPHVHAANER
jgi:O-antigen ligase